MLFSRVAYIALEIDWQKGGIDELEDSMQWQFFGSSLLHVIFSSKYAFILFIL